MAIKRSCPERLLLIFALACVVLVGSFLGLAGCDSVEDKQKEYRSEWLEIMAAFEKRVAADDKKGNELAQKNDIAGIMELVQKRVKYVDSTFDEIALLYPPADLRRLHSLTLFYLTSIVDQLEANIDLYEAARSGKPTADLQAIAEAAVKQTEAVKQELALEIDRVGLELEVPEGSEPAESVPGAPDSAPGGE